MSIATYRIILYARHGYTIVRIKLGFYNRKAVYFWGLNPRARVSEGVGAGPSGHPGRECVSDGGSWKTPNVQRSAADLVRYYGGDSRIKCEAAPSWQEAMDALALRVRRDARRH